MRLKNKKIVFLSSLFVSLSLCAMESGGDGLLGGKKEEPGRPITKPGCPIVKPGCPITKQGIVDEKVQSDPFADLNQDDLFFGSEQHQTTPFSGANSTQMQRKNGSGHASGKVSPANSPTSSISNDLAQKLKLEKQKRQNAIIGGVAAGRGHGQARSPHGAELSAAGRGRGAAVAAFTSGKTESIK